MHQLIWFQGGKYNLFLESILNISIVNLQKSPPWELKLPPKSGQ